MLKAELAWVEEACETPGGSEICRRDIVVRSVSTHDRWRANPADITPRRPAQRAPFQSE